MARCDPQSARAAGVSCAEFYRLQAEAARQTLSIRENLRSLGSAVSRRGELSAREQAAVTRLDKYMGGGVATDRAKIAFVHNILLNAGRQLEPTVGLAMFDRRLGSGGTVRDAKMTFGSAISANTILHEAGHLGTTPYLSSGAVPYILDGGNRSYFGYGSLKAALQRAKDGWQLTSKSAASFSWVVTGP